MPSKENGAILNEASMEEEYRDIFSKSRWGFSGLLFLSIRVFLALWMTWVIPLSIGSWIGGLDFKYYNTKLSFWGLWLEALYLWLCVITTSLAIWGPKDSKVLAWFARVTLPLQKTMLPMTFLVMYLGWAFIFHTGPQILLQFFNDRAQVHGWNFIVMLIDLFFNNQPLTIRDTPWSVVGCFSYLVYSYVYPAMGGTYEDGRSPYVYAPLNWQHNFNQAATLSFAVTFVIAPMVYLLCVLFAWLLNRVAPQTTDREVLLRVDNLEVTQTTAIKVDVTHAVVTQPGFFEVIFSVLPTLFLLALPLLAGTGITNTCQNFPHCEAWGISVAFLSANGPATLMMLMVFFYPLFRLRRPKAEVGGRVAAISLFVFQVSFIAVVCFWTRVAPHLHIIALGCMSVSGIIHYSIMIGECAPNQYPLTRLLLRIMVICNMAVFCFVIIGSFSNIISDAAPWVFYFFEVLGLSCVAVFPVVWRRDVLILRWEIFKHLDIHYELLEVSDTGASHLDLDIGVDSLEKGQGAAVSVAAGPVE